MVRVSIPGRERQPYLQSVLLIMASVVTAKPKSSNHSNSLEDNANNRWSLWPYGFISDNHSESEDPIELAILFLRLLIASVVQYTPEHHSNNRGAFNYFI